MIVECRTCHAHYGDWRHHCNVCGSTARIISNQEFQARQEEKRERKTRRRTPRRERVPRAERAPSPNVCVFCHKRIRRTPQQCPTCGAPLHPNCRHLHSQLCKENS